MGLADGLEVGRLRLSGAEATRDLGRAVGAAARAGDVVALYGDLGVGKTVFAQGVLDGLGCAGTHPSPTFTLVRAYASGRVPAYHVDVYRLGPAAPAEDLGWDEILGGEGVAVVEWADHLWGVLPAERLDVRLERPRQAEGERLAELTARGEVGRRLFRAALGATAGVGIRVAAGPARGGANGVGGAHAGRRC